MKNIKHHLFIWVLGLAQLPGVRAATVTREILTNAARLRNAPKWLNESKVTGVVSRIEQKLEWSTRRVDATFYTDQAAFTQALGTAVGPVLAFTRRSDQSMHFGPDVNAQNFALVFGHELVHVITFQKYKGHVPKWLEEGLANKIAGSVKVDYRALAEHPQVPVYSFAHPLSASSREEMNFYYMASLAFVNMLEKKCPSFREVLNLSLKDNLEKSLQTYCQLPADPTATFWTWLKKSTVSP